MSERKFYSMGEVAEMMDVTQTTIRFWESKFDVLEPHKNARGKRMFTPEDLGLLKTIYHLVKERGMTLAGARKHLKANRKAIERDMQIAERLHSIRALLVEVRQELGGEGIVIENTATEDVVAADSVPATGGVLAAEPAFAAAGSDFVSVTEGPVTGLPLEAVGSATDCYLSGETDGSAVDYLSGADFSASDDTCGETAWLASEPFVGEMRPTGVDPVPTANDPAATIGPAVVANEATEQKPQTEPSVVAAETPEAGTETEIEQKASTEPAAVTTEVTEQKPQTEPAAEAEKPKPKYVEQTLF